MPRSGWYAIKLRPRKVGEKQSRTGRCMSNPCQKEATVACSRCFLALCPECFEEHVRQEKRKKRA